MHQQGNHRATSVSTPVISTGMIAQARLRAATELDAGLGAALTGSASGHPGHITQGVLFQSEVIMELELV